MTTMFGRSAAAWGRPAPIAQLPAAIRAARRPSPANHRRIILFLHRKGSHASAPPPPPGEDRRRRGRPPRPKRSTARPTGRPNRQGGTGAGSWLPYRPRSRRSSAALLLSNNLRRYFEPVARLALPRGAMTAASATVSVSKVRRVIITIILAAASAISGSPALMAETITRWAAIDCSAG